MTWQAISARAYLEKLKVVGDVGARREAATELDVPLVHVVVHRVHLLPGLGRNRSTCIKPTLLESKCHPHDVLSVYKDNN